MRLLLIRHGKSSWDIPGQPDMERPLAARGHRQVKDLSEILQLKGWLPAKIFVSPSLRTQLTAALLRSSGWKAAEKFETQTVLYESDAAGILEWLKGAYQNEAMIALVGHNPYLNELIEYCTGRQIENLKTSGAVLLDWNSGSEWEEGQARLAWSHRLEEY